MLEFNLHENVWFSINGNPLNVTYIVLIVKICVVLLGCGELVFIVMLCRRTVFYCVVCALWSFIVDSPSADVLAVYRK